MSSDSISELPIHYGEIQKDGTRVERPPDDRPGRYSVQDEGVPQLKSIPQSATIHHPSVVGTADQDIPTRPSRDEAHASRGFGHGKSNHQHLGSEFETGRPGFDRYSRGPRERKRYDGYEWYTDDEEEGYEEPYRPRRIRARAYFPEDDYGPRRRPSRASRQANWYPTDRQRMMVEENDTGAARAPLRNRSHKQPRAGESFLVPQHGEGDEDDGEEEIMYARDASPPSNKQLRFQDLFREARKEILRLPWTQWMDSSTKNHFVATLGEFIGTTMFLWFAFAGTQVANIPSGDSVGNSTSGGATGFSAIVLLYIAIVFGFSLMVNVWVFFRISGGLFNPAVTLAMWLTSAIPLVRAVCLVCAQVAGSIAASALVLVQFPTALNVRTTLAGGTSLVQGVFIEAVLTAELVFTILMLAKEKHKATFIAPVGIGLALFIAELVGVFYTGGSLNPARSLGPCVVTRTFDAEQWIYWVGPGGGALMAVLFYKFIKMLEYEVANPGQDAEDTIEAAVAAAEKRRSVPIGSAL